MMTNLILIGMMGSGKSTLGRQLAKAHDLYYLDSDAAIETDQELTIPEIFKRHGETYFRDLEEKFLRQLNLKSHVLSTGGGIILRPCNRQRLKAMGHVVYLKTSVDVLYDRLVDDAQGRPLLKEGALKKTLEDLLNKRSLLYETTADDIIVTDEMSEKEVILALNKILRKIGYKL